jgi:hypothetical protein
MRVPNDTTHIGSDERQSGESIGDKVYEKFTKSLGWKRNEYASCVHDLYHATRTTEMFFHLHASHPNQLNVLWIPSQTLITHYTDLLFTPIVLL